jgi:integrase
MSEGDYSPDPELAKRPQIDWTAQGKLEAAALAFTDLLQVWIDWRKGREVPEASTVRQFKSRLMEFAAFVKHDDARRVTPEDIIRYRDSLKLAKNRRGGGALSPKTIKERIVTLSVIFRTAVSARKLPSNPAEGLTPAGKTKPQRAFTEDEARRILKAARREEGFKRWGSWLMQASGMRVEEAGQVGDAIPCKFCAASGMRLRENTGLN